MDFSLHCGILHPESRPVVPVFSWVDLSFYFVLRRTTSIWKWGRVPWDTGAAHRKGCGGLHAHTCPRDRNLLTLVLATPNRPLFATQQILNCALDDIEIFVSRLQKAAEAFIQLNSRNKSKKNKKKGPAGLCPFLLMPCHQCAGNRMIYCSRWRGLFYLVLLSAWVWHSTYLLVLTIRHLALPVMSPSWIKMYGHKKHLIWMQLTWLYSSGFKATLSKIQFLHSTIPYCWPINLKFSTSVSCGWKICSMSIFSMSGMFELA